MKRYQCIVCGFIHDEAAGVPNEGIAAGTACQDVPDNRECPDCGAATSDFELLKIWPRIRRVDAIPDGLRRPAAERG